MSARDGTHEGAPDPGGAPLQPQMSWSRALAPLLWAAGLLVFTWIALYLIRRYLR